jgi:beta-lactamase regulating signal transducer with metallopeptidase domain/uncharacterized membrane protein YkoI
MRTSSQFLLTFLLNAGWQVALVAALASVSSWLLRDSSARYRHWIWVSALVLSAGLPAVTYSQLSRVSPANVFAGSEVNRSAIPGLALDTVDTQQAGISLNPNEAFLLNRGLALTLLALYAVVLCYGALRLAHAFYVTRKLRLDCVDVGHNGLIDSLVEKCLNAISGKLRKPDIRVSATVPVPITIGVLDPVIILPEQLLREGSEEILTSAIGHELVHIGRRDYALNFVYELLYLPLSFHPGAALIRRRIRQTRELSCDELVAERILKPEVYARSLVKLVSSAPALHRLSVITTVGIADADILEARVMSLLRKSGTHTRRKGLLLVASSLLLLASCVAAAAFAVRFDVASAATGLVPQDPARNEKQIKDEKIRVRSPGSEEEFKERMKSDPKFREEVEHKREIEFKMRAARQTALLNLARINMDQAIQIATSQYPGKVLQCSLDAENWKEPGILDSDGRVFYRVVLISSEDAQSGGATHVWVNAIDGTVIKSEKELPRKRKPE